jgi:hypothetical protein
VVTVPVNHQIFIVVKFSAILSPLSANRTQK